jgi:hypothetical protein
VNAQVFESFVQKKGKFEWCRSFGGKSNALHSTVGFKKDFIWLVNLYVMDVLNRPALWKST